MTQQIPSIILPTTYATGTGTLAATENIADIAEHTSVEFPVEFLQEKSVLITATEVALLPAAVPPPLHCWVELSPYPTANNNYWPEPFPISAAYWAAIGGGGGAIAPTTPHIEVSGLGGAAGTLVHPIILPWNIHNTWARAVLQTPAIVANTSWVVQVLFSGCK